MEQLPKYVVDAIWKGRAVLIAGQDLARGETRDCWALTTHCPVYVLHSRSRPRRFSNVLPRSEYLLLTLPM